MINDNYWCRPEAIKQHELSPPRDVIECRLFMNSRYQLYIDDLPIWAFVGEHSKFAVDVSHDLTLMFSRSVHFVVSESNVPMYPSLRPILHDVPRQQQVSPDAVRVSPAGSKATQGRQKSRKADLRILQRNAPNQSFNVNFKLSALRESLCRESTLTGISPSSTTMIRLLRPFDQDGKVFLLESCCICDFMQATCESGSTMSR